MINRKLSRLILPVVLAAIVVLLGFLEWRHLYSFSLTESLFPTDVVYFLGYSLPMYLLYAPLSWLSGMPAFKATFFPIYMYLAFAGTIAVLIFSFILWSLVLSVTTALAGRMRIFSKNYFLPLIPAGLFVVILGILYAIPLFSFSDGVNSLKSGSNTIVAQCLGKEVRQTKEILSPSLCFEGILSEQTDKLKTAKDKLKYCLSLSDTELVYEDPLDSGFIPKDISFQEYCVYMLGDDMPRDNKAITAELMPEFSKFETKYSLASADDHTKGNLLDSLNRGALCRMYGQLTNSTAKLDRCLSTYIRRPFDTGYYIEPYCEFISDPKLEPRCVQFGS